MDYVLVGSLLVGALAATGVLILVNELMPATPALGPALRRLHPDLPVAPRRLRGRGLLRRVPVPYETLALLDQPVSKYFSNLAVAAGAGAVLPMVGVFILFSGGRSLPVSPVLLVPVLSVAGAVLFAVIAHADVRFRAKKVRAEFRSVVAVYLSLVAMERGAGHGTVESLERAAEVGDGWVVQRIRQTLVRARAHHRPPWDELIALGDELGVPELSDVGQIMQSSGQSGAQVNRTLLERADSLRDQMRAADLAKAEATTGKLEIPGALLLFLLAAFVIYPIMQQVYVGMN